MFAAAIVAALTGGPLGVCLLLAYGAVHALKVHKVDAQYAARGETPPSYALVNRWLDRQKAAGKAPADAKPAKYGMWRYAWQRWQAMWEDLSTDFATRHDAEKKARADARANGLPVPPRRTLKDKLAALKGWKWQIVTPAVDRQNTATVDDLTGRTSGAQPVNPDDPRTACEDCGQTLTPVGGKWAHPSSAGCPRQPVDTTATASEIARRSRKTGPCTVCAAGPPIPWHTCPTTPTPEGARSVATEQQAAGDRFAATATAEAAASPTKQAVGAIHNSLTNGAPHHRSNQPTNGGNTMTTTQHSGEVIGTRSAVHYAEAMAAAHAEHASNEGFVSSLARMEVGDGDISKVRAAMEKSRMAGAAWKEAADSIDANNARLREAYAQAPDAANKAANTNE